MGTQRGLPQTQPSCGHPPAVLGSLGPRQQGLKDPAHPEGSSREPPAGLPPTCRRTSRRAREPRPGGRDVLRAPPRPTRAPAALSWAQAARARPLLGRGQGPHLSGKHFPAKSLKGSGDQIPRREQEVRVPRGLGGGGDTEGSSRAVGPSRSRATGRAGCPRGLEASGEQPPGRGLSGRGQTRPPQGTTLTSPRARARALSRFCCFHAFTTSCSYRELVPLTKPRQGRSTAAPPEHRFPGPRVHAAGSAPASDPEQERPAQVFTCPFLLPKRLPPGAPVRGAGQPRRQHRLPGGFHAPALHSPPATRPSATSVVWPYVTPHTDRSSCSCWTPRLPGAEGPRARPPMAVTTTGGGRGR